MCMQVVITSLTSATDEGGTNLSVQMANFTISFFLIFYMYLYRYNVALDKLDPWRSSYYKIKSYGFL